MLGLAAVAAIAVFSRKLIYWHSTWQHSVNEVLAGHSHAAGPAGGADREALSHLLETWDMHLHECIVPAGAPYARQSLAELQIPGRFGCLVVEVERNRFAITQPSFDFVCYPGDKLLLLGRAAEIESACAFLEGEADTAEQSPDFERAVLESFVVPGDGAAGKTLGELQVARRTGVRVLGIDRHDARILIPHATEVLRPGDRLLGLGTLDQLQSFRSWLAHKPQRA